MLAVVMRMAIVVVLVLPPLTLIYHHLFHVPLSMEMGSINVVTVTIT
jgi:hypothetical protein